MRQPLPIVVIGAGRVSQAAHLREIFDLPELLRVVAIIDDDQARAAQGQRHHPEAAICADLPEALAAGARAALCCTPWWTHAEVVHKCVTAGLPVLCEKPVSLDPAEIDAMTEAARNSAVTVTAGYMKRHDPVVQGFIEHCRSRLPDARRLSVSIADPNAPHQVEHLVRLGAGPRAEPPAAAGEAVLRALGVQATPVQREAYARGLGGSLVHHVNLVHAILAGSGLRLAGRLLNSTQWADVSAVAVSWKPSDSFVVDMCHLRLPSHRSYREEVEFTSSSGTATLSMPSPYSRDQGASLRLQTWAEPTGLLQRTDHHAPVGRTGFRRQLERWAEAVQSGSSEVLPGLDQAKQDLAVVREAALALS